MRHALLTLFAFVSLDVVKAWEHRSFGAIREARGKIEFAWFEGYGMYQDFEPLNQQIPGYAALRFRFVAKHAPIHC